MKKIIFGFIALAAVLLSTGCPSPATVTANTTLYAKWMPIVEMAAITRPQPLTTRCQEQKITGKACL